jgi:hypothetical protein
MTSRFFAIAAVGVLTAISAVSAVGPAQPMLHRPNAAGRSTLHVSGGRSLQQRQSAGSKFDAALADISRHLNTVRADHALADLHALNPAARFIQPADSSTPLVSIDAVTRGDPQQLKAALIALGLQHPAVYSNDVGGWLPVNQLDAATALAEVHAIRAAMHRTRSGAVTSQGDFVQHSDVVRSANSLTGAGVTVGVLSDSFDCYAQYAASGLPAGGNTGYASNGFLATAATDVSTGDLPANVNVLQEVDCPNYGAPLQLPFGDEGRAMLQIVHDVAPGAGLAFYTADNSEADFAMGIVTLAAPVSAGGAGAKVIADDVGYFDEPFFQDGIVAQAVDAVAAQGVAYFSAAGNNGTLGYDDNAPDFSTVSTSAPNSGEHLLSFGSGSNKSTTLPVIIPPLAPGEFVAIVLEWDQPYVTGAPHSGGATSEVNLCAIVKSGNDEITDDNLGSLPSNCTGANALGADPVQIIIVGNPANNPAGNSSQEEILLQVGVANATNPTRIKIAVEDDGAGSQIANSVATNSGTIQGHPGATGAAAVGAAFFAHTPACGITPATLESYSSAGGDPILFDVNGVRIIPIPAPRQKPDFVGPDGGNNTFLGFQLADGGPPDNSTVAGCANNASFPNFFGTSAATPHVAGIAALFLQANPSVTPAQIIAAMQSTALPMSGSTPNFSSGFGFVQADVAAGAIPAVVPAAPVVTLNPSTVMIGSTSTLTWSAANTTGCTASGSWSGAMAASGTQTITATAAGTDTYTLVCANVAGTSSATSAILTVSSGQVGPPTQPGPSTGGGGGALGLGGLIGLAGLLTARVRRAARPPVRDLS